MGVSLSDPTDLSKSTEFVPEAAVAEAAVAEITTAELAALTVAPLVCTEGGDDEWSILAAIDTPETTLAKRVEFAKTFCSLIPWLHRDPELGEWGYGIWNVGNSRYQVIFTPFAGDIFSPEGDKSSPWCHKPGEVWAFFGIAVDENGPPVAAFCAYNPVEETRSLWRTLDLPAERLLAANPLEALIAALPADWQTAYHHYYCGSDFDDEPETDPGDDEPELVWDDSEKPA